MQAGNTIRDAGLYTDFGGLAQLRARASSQTAEANGNEKNNNTGATKEVAKQFEALFIQMMLKSMREASQLSESTDSEQTRFYQEMFDKQIAIDLASREGGIGLADVLERDLTGVRSANQASDLVRNQIQQSTSLINLDKRGEG